MIITLLSVIKCSNLVILGGSGIGVLGGSGSFSAVVLYSLRALKLTLSRCFTYRVPLQPWKGATPLPHPQPLLSCKQEAGAIGWVQIPGRKARAGMWALNDPVWVPGITRKGNTCEKWWENEDLRKRHIDNVCKIKLDITFHKVLYLGTLIGFFLLNPQAFRENHVL